MSAQKTIVKAVIPAAGFGTRMLPATKALPKEMLPVAGKPLIQYAVEEAISSGIETIVLVIRDHKPIIQAHFAEDRELESFLVERQQAAAAKLVHRLGGGADIRYVEQEKPLGLAHAITCARPVVGEQAFVVLLPDVIVVDGEPVTRQLIRAHGQCGGSVVAVSEVEPQDVERYGIVRAERSANLSPGECVRVTAVVEKPPLQDAPSRLGIFGRYLFEPAIWDAIAVTPPDARGEVQLTDALNALCNGRLLHGCCFAGRHYDAGDRVGYLKANIEISLRDPHLQQPLREYLSQLRV